MDKKNLIEKYPYLGYSPNIIEYFGIIGYHEELIPQINSPRESAITILVFGCIICFFHFFKIMIFFMKDGEDCVKIFETMNMGALFINICKSVIS